MRTVAHLACLTLLAFIDGLAAPVINQIGNAYGLRPAISIHSGIARGGLLALLGSQLGPDAELTADGELDSILGGVTVILTTPTASYLLPLRSVSATRVIALVPVEVPAGRASLTLSYGGLNTSAAVVEVVDATFGIATQLETGFGPAFASNVTGDTVTLNTLLNPARPQQQVILYGTGLGVTGESPIVWVGNFQAELIDAGSTGCCKGVDEIKISIPEGIEGCYVPVAVQIGNTISNFVSLAIAPGEAPCSDALSFTREELERIQTLDKVRLGVISVRRYDSDFAQAKFVQYERAALLQSVSVFGMPPFGTCTVNPQSHLGVFTLPQTYMDERRLADPAPIVPRRLDAGAQLQAQNVPAVQIGLTDTRSTMLANGPGTYYGGFLDRSRPRTLEVLDPGLVDVTGPGGGEVGSFQAEQQFASDPKYSELWPSLRSDNWVPGKPSPELLWSQTGHPIPAEQYSEILMAMGDQVMVCSVAPGTGKFQVPGFVTLSIALRAPDGSTYIPTLGPHIGLAYLPTRFTADGIDIGVFFSRNFK